MSTAFDNLATPGSIKRAAPLYDEVYEILWKKILSGEIQPSQRLHDTEWATQLHVSRTPVREALRKLEHENMLVPLPSGGYRVREVTAQDLQQLYACRAALEALTASEAAKNMTSAILSRLQKAIDAAEKCLAREAFFDVLSHHTDFHEQITLASGNGHLIRLLHSLSRMILFNRRSFMNAVRINDKSKSDYIKHLKSSQKDHLGILKALKAGDSRAAERLMRDHTLDTARKMSAILDTLKPA